MNCYTCDTPLAVAASSASSAPIGNAIAPHRAFEHRDTQEVRAFCSQDCVQIGLSRAKACKMLHDHSFTTKKQQGYFGATCSGKSYK